MGARSAGQRERRGRETVTPDEEAIWIVLAGLMVVVLLGIAVVWFG